MHDPKNIIGYFGVIIPKKRFWQGFFLSNHGLDDAQKSVSMIKKKVGGVYMPPSAVITPIDGVSEENQPWVGAMSSTLVELAQNPNEPKILSMAQSLHLITGFTHFYIIADIDRFGTHTEIINLDDAKTADAVRNAIENHPEVLKIKRILLTHAKTNSRTKH